jgi:hypothetical protein
VSTREFLMAVRFPAMYHVVSERTT